MNLRCCIKATARKSIEPNWVSINTKMEIEITYDEELRTKTVTKNCKRKNWKL